MKIPAEFSGRVLKTKLSGLTSDFRKIDEIMKDWQGAEIDVIYENQRSIVVIVFETQEDCLAFILKKGHNYV